jgi:hypothetical protein
MYTISQRILLLYCTVSL